MVNMINTCKFRSSDPKFNVQLAKTTNREVLEWEGIIRRMYCPSPNKPNNKIYGLRLYEDCFLLTFYWITFYLVQNVSIFLVERLSNGVVYTDSQIKMIDVTFKKWTNWILHKRMTTAEILEKFPIFLSHHIDKKFDKAVLLHLEYQYLTITNPCYGNSKSSVGTQKGLVSSSITSVWSY